MSKNQQGVARSRRAGTGEPEPQGRIPGAGGPGRGYQRGVAAAGGPGAEGRPGSRVGVRWFAKILAVGRPGPDARRRGSAGPPAVALAGDTSPKNRQAVARSRKAGRQEATRRSIQWELV